MKSDFSSGFTGWLFLAGALMFWGGWVLLPVKIGVFFTPEDFAAVLLGVAAMALTMGFPDNLEFYVPVFHLNSLWLLATGLVVRRSGLGLGARAGVVEGRG